jgi:hypothetical protein
MFVFKIEFTTPQIVINLGVKKIFVSFFLLEGVFGKGEQFTW